MEVVKGDEWGVGACVRFDPNLSYRPTISVIVLSHRKELVGEAMASVWAQTYPADQIEMIVKFGTVYHGDKLNEAVRAARGEFVTVLCDDDRLAPTFLARAMDVIRPGTDFVYFDALVFGGPGPAHIHVMPEFSRESVRTACVPWMTMCIRKRVLTKLRKQYGHIYDPKMQYLDWDLDKRLVKAGAVGVRIPEPLFEVRLHETNGHRAMNHYDAFLLMRHKHLFLEPPVPTQPEEPFGKDYGIPENFWETQEGRTKMLAICNP